MSSILSQHSPPVSWVAQICRARSKYARVSRVVSGESILGIKDRVCVALRRNFGRRTSEHRSPSRNEDRRQLVTSLGVEWSGKGKGGITPLPAARRPPTSRAQRRYLAEGKSLLDHPRRLLGSSPKPGLPYFRVRAGRPADQPTSRPTDRLGVVVVVRVPQHETDNARVWLLSMYIIYI